MLGQKGLHRSRAVTVDLRRLAAVKKNDVLRVQLFDDTVFQARFEKRDDFGPGHYSWGGTLDGREHSLFVISVCQGAVTGSFTHTSVEHPFLIDIQTAPGHTFVRELEQTHRNPPIKVART